MMALADHLWQSTLVVLAAAVLARVVGAHHAALRHGIWLAASIKFLIPFSLLVEVGARAGTWLIPAVTVPAIPDTWSAVGQPFSMAITAEAGSSATQYVSRALLAVWLTGSFALATVRLMEWRRLARLARPDRHTVDERVAEAVNRIQRSRGTYSAITLVETPAVQEPGLFGFIRPIIFWPKGLTPQLQYGELNAIVTHELCHARRFDNATSALHMVVESLFWFHPAVWWIGARLVEEQEGACDAAVLRLGAAPDIYAGALIKVCRFSLRPSGPFVAAIGGSNRDALHFTRRVEVIMAGSDRGSLGMMQTAVVALTAALIVGGPVATGFATEPTPKTAPADPAQRQVALLPAERSFNTSPRDAKGTPASAAAGRQNAGQPVRAIRFVQADPVAEFRKGALSPDTPNLTKPVAKHMERPSYPAEARKRNAQGDVQLEAIVAPDGSVTRVRIVKGLDPALDEAAKQAVLKWTFQPAKLGGKAVAVWTEIEMRFGLH